MNDVNGPDGLAKRATELAARATELAQQAQDAAATDEELRRLDEALAELEAEARRLDESLDGAGPDDSDGDDDVPFEWARSLAHEMEDVAGQVADAVRSALTSSGRRWSDVQEHREPVAGARPVRVVSPGGSVDVTVGSSTEVVVRTRRLVGGVAPGRSVDISVTEEGDELLIAVQRHRRRLGRGATQLEVEVPSGSPVRITTGGGGITVAGTGSAVWAQTGGGGIRVQGATDVDAVSGGGGIRVTGADGSVKARTGGGGIRVKGSLRGESSLSSGGGSIVVNLDPGCQLEVAGRGSATHTDIPDLTASRSRISGTIGSGADGRLTMRTGGGGVVVHKL